MHLRGLLTITLCAMSYVSIASEVPDVQIIGKISQPVNTNSTNLRVMRNAFTVPRSVTLMKLQLSDNAWMNLESRVGAQEQPVTTMTMNSTSHNKQLGMNNVPVLDQGPFGTCATFANVAAMDAALEQGDDISIVCALQLGTYLENNGYGMSGWDGSLGPLVLHQLQTFGFVSKSAERSQGCGGLTEYPSRPGQIPSTEMSLVDYHALSQALPDSRVSWSGIVDVYQVFVDKVAPDLTLKQVMSALDAGDRLTLGVLLFSTDQGVAGAVGKHYVQNDTWILTPAIRQDIINHGEFGGHEMVITGYDDEAVAVDNQGQRHKGLLTLRNSWGDQVGHHGDFYMSYDYFKTLVIEVQRIRQLH